MAIKFKLPPNTEIIIRRGIQVSKIVGKEGATKRSGGLVTSVKELRASDLSKAEFEKLVRDEAIILRPLPGYEDEEE